MLAISVALLPLLSLTLALPTPVTRDLQGTCIKHAAGGITEARLLAIAPSSRTCAATGMGADQCRTAAQAAPLLDAAHAKFNITTRGEKAALVGLQMFESGQLKFDRNQGGNPGQGTRNMMNFPFMYQYALDTPATKAAALALVPAGTALSTVSANTQNKVLALMLPDDLSFASAAWFLKRSTATSETGCDDNIIQGLQAETEAGWEAYITQCVGTTVTPERKQVYQAALAALA